MASKAWIYAGLGLAAGVSAVGLVRVLTAPRIRPGRTRLFVVGDSMAVGLRPHLAALSQESKIALESLAKEGTRIDQWAHSKVLQDKLTKFQPTLVLVVLGTNDEYLGTGARERQAPYLKDLLANLERTGADVVWVGPPALARSSGIRELIRSQVPDSRYFPSDTLQIPRGPDQLHPTARGYAGWAGAIWRWLS